MSPKDFILHLSGGMLGAVSPLTDLEQELNMLCGRDRLPKAETLFESHETKRREVQSEKGWQNGKLILM